MRLLPDLSGLSFILIVHPSFEHILHVLRTPGKVFLVVSY